MGCICSFFRTLTSYHGSHLTAHQVNRQRQQRAKKTRPSRDSPPPLTPEKPQIAPSPFIAPPPGRSKGAGEEEKLLLFNPQKHKLGDCGKQSSFSQPKNMSQSKFNASFNKS